MKLFTHLITITVLSICCLTTSAQTWSQVEWDNITETDEIMITMTADNGTGTTYAMNNNGASTPIAVIVTYAAGSITIVTSGYTMDNLLWNLNTSTGRIYPKGSTTTWLYTTNSNSGVRIGTNTTSGYIWSIDGNYLKTNEGTNNRWLGVYKNNPDWRAYTNTTGNTVNQVVKFYKKSGATPPTVATPTFTPAAGLIHYPQLITINCDTDGSTIYYTTNGDEPTTSSNVYSTPIQVLNTTTIKAIAVKSDMTNSQIASASYNFAQNEQYVRINNLTALPADSRVIFAARFDGNSNQYYAMHNTTSGKPVGVLFTSSTIESNEVLPSTIMESADTYYFTVGINGSNYTFTNATGNLIGYSSGTDFTTGGSNTEWVVSSETSSASSMVPNYSAFTVTNKGINTRAFALNTSHNFGSYATSNNSSSSYNFFVDIFVKNDASASSYTIDNVNELVALRIGINSGEAFTYKGNSVPAGGEGIDFQLTADLDLSSVCGASVGSGTSWTPIGNFTQQFKGHFHGGGHSISNLYINAPTSDYQGLFGYVDGGSIDSLNLVNTNVTGQQYVGGVCGRNYNYSEISHCLNSGSVSGTGYYVGGVCGYNDNTTLSYCTNSGSVSVSETEIYVGG
ncbi:MAG: chitobiase/beta-hexosaminidase C-terminal domain-containing protein, partial [Bacteroidales bacterium]|nr:chitobiase/beta-hexosaminidase C-terminal domain-containing protein [Bacteroidales bacterium]